MELFIKTCLNGYLKIKSNCITYNRYIMTFRNYLAGTIFIVLLVWGPIDHSWPVWLAIRIGYQTNNLISAYRQNLQVSGSYGFLGEKQFDGNVFSKGLLFELKRITGKDYSVELSKDFV